MPDEELQLKKLLKELFKTQLFAALATQHSSRPYNNLIAFAATEDIKEILFVTNRGTRKYANLLASSSVSVLVDSRTNQDSDFRNAVAVTAVGTAEEVKDKQKETLLRLYLVKHHNLEKFANSAGAALFRVKVKAYYIVRNFQEVMELKMEQ
ncbi:MAG: pyridoxamine 5'-phosphate oxidase family protein [Dehalococcoidia bacterium]|nr:pyridoxamine 5'-phosphate oxidase family protein [Dehalococcoidia bacterium]MDD5493961.1 pyridoxamine 5'-phosphate oxidase family protein [Dehalococcoidia bacterium]